MTNRLTVYIPQDRRGALARGEALPDRTHGAALFADISGFTPLTEALARILGPRRGAEALTQQLDAVYTALVAQIERFGGSVVSFAGDALTCWFDDHDGPAARRAVACAQALQIAMAPFAALSMPDGTATVLALKAAVASGSARRLVVGDPAIQLLDALAGATIARTAAAEQLARPGEVLLDSPTADALGAALQLAEWRADPTTHERFGVVGAFRARAPRRRPADDATTPERWREWLLPAVFAREQAGQGAFLTEFRPAIALFLRFVGIDYEHDAAGAQLDAFIRQVQGILARYEGVLLQLTIGDKGSYLYAAFGAPIAHEDDARRALRAALDLQRAVTTLGFLHPLQIGLSRGTMRTGAYGGATRRTYGVLGDDVNLAARLMMHAQPGEILVSESVQAATAAEFGFAAYPALRVKGKAESQAIFAVLGAHQHPAMRLQEPTYALPMVGRQAELATISARLQQARQSQGQVVGIVAEAGLGKSRLLAEVIHVARAQGFVGYGGACQSDGVTTPYLVWRPIWRAFFDVDPALPLDRQVQALAALLASYASERVEALPLLGAVLDLSLPDTDYTQALDPQARKSVLHTLLQECLTAVARATPLLLVFEDLHWIDALSHDLLDELAREIAGLPILIVLAYRPPELQRLQTPRLEALPHFTKVTLNQLTPADSALVIAAKLAQHDQVRAESVPPILVATLTEKAQGNPFYLEELLNYLQDRGRDPFDPAALEALELPDSLHALILSRIDQLTEREQTTLRVASIIGRLFRAAWLPGYYPALGDPAQVNADLRELDRLELTPLATPAPELAYLFKHIVTHEVTYESLPYATRARLHEQLARYLEASEPDAPLLDALAYHYGQSTNTAKQREYFHKAAASAQATFANDTALAYYARLLPLLDAPGAQAEGHLQWGAVLELLGRWAEAEAHYRDALVCAGQDRAVAARAQLALGILYRLRGDYVAARAWLEQAREGCEALGDQAGLANAQIETGRVLWRQGEYAASLQQLQAGLAHARSSNDTLQEAMALNIMGLVADSQGDYVLAGARLEESLALRRAANDRRGVAMSLNNLGLVADHQADYVLARARYSESLALQRELGDKRAVALVLGNLGLVACHLNDAAAAKPLLHESLALQRELGDKHNVANVLNIMGYMAVNQGDAAAAKPLLHESLVLRRALGNKRGIAEALGNLSEVALIQGETAAARALLHESLALFREVGDKPGLAGLLSKLGLVALRQGEAAAARTLFAESLARWRELGNRAGMAQSLIGLAGVAFLQGASVEAVRVAAAAEQVLATMNYVLDLSSRKVLDDTVVGARAVLGEAALARAWAEGQALTLDDAIAHPLTSAHDPAPE